MFDITISMIVPNPQENQTLVSKNNSDYCFTYVNFRPVILKNLIKIVKKAYFSAESGNRFLSFIFNVQIVY